MTAIRLAALHDAAAIQAIYAPIVRETAISFELEAPSVDEIAGRMDKTVKSFPWLVYEYDQQIVGYAYATKHRERAAYQWSVDVTVYVQPNRHRSGIGRALYTTLFSLLRLQGFYSAYAGIALPNDKSIGLHRALGFEAVGVYHNVGCKLGRWHDVSWWQLKLQEPVPVPSAPLPLDAIQDSPEWKAALALNN